MFAPFVVGNAVFVANLTVKELAQEKARESAMLGRSSGNKRGFPEMECRIQRHGWRADFIPTGTLWCYYSKLFAR